MSFQTHSRAEPIWASPTCKPDEGFNRCLVPLNTVQIKSDQMRQSPPLPSFVCSAGRRKQKKEKKKKKGSFWKERQGQGHFRSGKYLNNRTEEDKNGAVFGQPQQ